MAELRPDLDIDLRLRQSLPRDWKQHATGVYRRPSRADSPQVVVRGTIVQGAKQGTMQPHGGRAAPLDRYLRAGKGWHGQDAVLFGPRGAGDHAAFLARVQADLSRPQSHQFRLVVSLASPHPYFALRPYIETYMAQVSRDLRRSGQTTRPLDWIAAVHRDTGHPHAHIILRGTDLQGQPVYMQPQYLSEGLRTLARELARQFLGAEIPREQTQAPTPRMSPAPDFLAQRSQAEAAQMVHEDLQESLQEDDALDEAETLQMLWEKNDPADQHLWDDGPDGPPAGRTRRHGLER